MHAKGRIALASVALCCGVAGIVGCAPQASEPPDNTEAIQNLPESPEYSQEQLDIIAGAEGTVPGNISLDAYPGKDYLDSLHEMWDANSVDYQPELRELEDGQIVQRTPSEPNERARQGLIPYNNYRLNNDNRGCNSCHADLSSLLENLSNTMHPSADSPALDAEMTVDQCLFCHTYSPGYIPTQYEFGTMIHNIHYGQVQGAKFQDEYDGDCYSCHDATNDDTGKMALWDQVKFKHLRGITAVENVEGEFATDQERTMEQKDLVNMDAWNRLYDRMRSGSEYAGTNMPQSLFDEWEITVSGNVEKPYTAKLPDLVKEAEEAGVVVTKVSKLVCNWNGTGLGSISNAEITGIPVSWILEKAGAYAEDTNGVRVMRADGSSKRAMPIEKVENGEAFLVYQINGEPLMAQNGYPCMNWVEGVDGEVCSKEFNEYVVTNEAPDFNDFVYEFEHHDGNPNGWLDGDGNWTNKPNATILDVPEGLCIQSGQPYTFNGYADAYDEKITSVEFSMDQGKTWTKFDIADMDPNKALWWTFTWTPPEAGAYCLSVRATTESGLVSPYVQTVMVNAKDTMPTAEDTIELNGYSLVPAQYVADNAAKEQE